MICDTRFIVVQDHWLVGTIVVRLGRRHLLSTCSTRREKQSDTLLMGITCRAGNYRAPTIFDNHSSPATTITHRRHVCRSTNSLTVIILPVSKNCRVGSHFFPAYLCANMCARVFKCVNISFARPPVHSLTGRMNRK